jgi:hypothetical protein
MEILYLFLFEHNINNKIMQSLIGTRYCKLLRQLSLVGTSINDMAVNKVFRNVWKWENYLTFDVFSLETLETSPCTAKYLLIYLKEISTYLMH